MCLWWEEIKSHKLHAFTSSVSSDWHLWAHESSSSPFSIPDLSPSSRDHDFRLLDDLVHEDSIHMHELSLRSNFRHKRDTSSDELESMAKLKKTSTKKATQVFKPKPSPVNPFKSTSLAPAYPADASSSRIETSDSSGHIISPSVSSSGSSASSFTASSPAEGSPFFAPEDVTLPPNSNSSVSVLAF